jgi:DedD protein
MMERALKERIIGAAVLVLVVVLVVPVFLDGPPEQGAVVSERVPLPGQSEQETKTVVLDRDRSSPVPANGSSDRPATTPRPQPAPAQSAAQPDPDPEPAAAQPVQKPAAEEVAPQPAADESSTGMWAVQLGSFGNADNAERLAADLRSEGHAAFLSQVSTSAGQRHRVRIGPQKDRAAAEAVAAKLREAGHDVKVLPHP